MGDYADEHLEELGGDDSLDQEHSEEPSEVEDEDDDEPESRLLARAKKHFQIAADSEKQIRKDALEDLKFCQGDQWPTEIRNQREQDRRPCLTVNQLPQFVRQITNDQRQNRPAIKIDAMDLNVDTRDAEIREGLIRHIELQSNAEIAYDTAFEQAAKGGFGYFRIDHDYKDSKSFDQEIFIRRIRNQFSVYLDPSAQEPDGSDACWGHVYDEMTKAEFRAEFPESALAQMDDWTSIGDQAGDWFTTDGCRISEYFEKKFERKRLYLMSDGNSYLEDETPEQLEPGVHLMKTRWTVDPCVYRYKINGIEVLEKTRCPGQYIPIVPVYGDEYMIEGVRTLEGVIRHAKDPQRIVNFMRSAEIEAIALAPKAPWLIAEGQDEGFKNIWKNVNRENYATLPYKPKTIGGEVVPPPRRIVEEPAIQAISAAGAQFQQDLRSTTGVYDSELGNKSNENSGIAIQRRNHQSQVSNFHFSDNFARSLKHAGRIILEWLPVIYDTPRTIRLVNAEGESEIIWINKIFMENGQPKLIRLDQGNFDVAVDTGPSYVTKRQEAVAAMIDITGKYPKLMDIAGDVMVQNMDWPGAKVVANRIKKTLPPGLADDPKNKDPIPPQAQAQMQQMQQTIQMLQQNLMAAQKVIETDQIKTQSKERVEYEKLKANLAIEVMKHEHGHAENAFKAETAVLDKQLDMLSPKFFGINPNPPAPQGPNGGGPTNLTGGQPGTNPGGS